MIIVWVSLERVKKLTQFKRWRVLTMRIFDRCSHINSPVLPAQTGLTSGGPNENLVSEEYYSQL